MKILCATLFACTFSAYQAFAQNADGGIASDTLKDTKGNLYILSKDHTRVKAINNKGDILWDTNPADDAKVPKYYKFISGREREINYFKLEENTLEKPVINISYNNTQSGTIDITTGKFHFIGQD